MGVVYLAFDSGIARPVAIKSILIPETGSLNAAESLRAALIREARAAGSMAHPGIVTMHQMGESGGMVYLVMEYLPGGSLDDRLTEEAPVDPAWALQTLAQIAGALDYAHGAGFVHRDIKPGNILLASEKADVVKIADFGLARMVNSSQSLDKIAGTPHYMSPEQINGERLDGRSDQFALAQLAYRLLAGRVAFQADDTRTLLARILTATEPPAHAINPRLHPQVSQVLSKGLAKLPLDRFANCLDLIEALRLALQGQWMRPQDRSDEPSYPPPALPKKPSAWAPVLGAVAATGAVAGLVLAAEAFTRPDPSIYKKAPVSQSGQPPQSGAAAAPRPKSTKELIDEVNLRVKAVNESRIRAGAPIEQPPSSPATPATTPAAQSANAELTERLANGLRERNMPLAAVRDMLDRGASAKGGGEHVPLVEAARACNTDAVRLLLAKGANPNFANSSGETALAESFDYRNRQENCPDLLGLVKLLLDGGAKPNGPPGSRPEQSPPWRAGLDDARGFPILRLLVERGADATLALSPVAGQKAAACSSIALDFLLSHNANPNGVSTKNGLPGEPLRKAAMSGCPQYVRSLLSKGAKPNASDFEGRTALHLIVQQHSGQNPAVVKEIVLLLLASGADMNLLDKPWESRSPAVSPLELAFANHEIPDLTGLMIDRYGDPKRTDRDGRTPLHLAAKHNNAAAIRLLLSRGLDVNVRDKNGMTALGLSRRMDPSHGQPVIKLLLAANAKE